MPSRPTEQLSVDIRRVGGSAVVRLCGSAGMGEAPHLKEQLDLAAEAPAGVVVLDLADLEFISSAGLGAILYARARITSEGGKMRLINPRPFVLQLLQTTRLDQLFTICSSLDDALQES